ncbi:hypothetical protein Pelo_5065 [Pelomyxa schiedti]|nr:hypothetical protein Pelo_5065 [Pelomyxa schiedti]
MSSHYLAKITVIDVTEEMVSPDASGDRRHVVSGLEMRPDGSFLDFEQGIILWSHGHPAPKYGQVLFVKAWFRNPGEKSGETVLVVKSYDITYWSKDTIPRLLVSPTTTSEVAGAKAEGEAVQPVKKRYRFNRPIEMKQPRPDVREEPKDNQAVALTSTASSESPEQDSELETDFITRSAPRKKKGRNNSNKTKKHKHKKTSKKAHKVVEPVVLGKKNTRKPKIAACPAPAPDCPTPYQELHQRQLKPISADSSILDELVDLDWSDEPNVKAGTKRTRGEALGGVVAASVTGSASASRGSALEFTSTTPSSTARASDVQSSQVTGESPKLGTLQELVESSGTTTKLLMLNVFRVDDKKFLGIDVKGSQALVTLLKSSPALKSDEGEVVHVSGARVTGAAGDVRLVEAASVTTSSRQGLKVGFNDALRMLFPHRRPDQKRLLPCAATAGARVAQLHKDLLTQNKSKRKDWIGCILNKVRGNTYNVKFEDGQSGPVFFKAEALRILKRRTGKPALQLDAGDVIAVKMSLVGYDPKRTVANVEGYFCLVDELSIVMPLETYEDDTYPGAVFLRQHAVLHNRH